MSDTKFTPGPWVAGSVHEDEYGFEVVNVGKGESFSGAAFAEESICQVFSMNNEGQFSANAHLVAAAPELYEALDDLLEQCTAEDGDPEDYIAALKRGNEVIAKARGK
jgi:hypothetical protein